MSQKTNPLKTKLGQIKLWNFEFSKYGQNFKNYTKFLYLRNNIFSFIKNFCLKYNLLIENININQKIYETNFNVFVVFLKTSQETNKDNNFLKVILKWINTNIKISFYKNTSLTNTTMLIKNYIIYLFINKKISPKKALLYLYKTLKNQKKKNQIKYTIQGIKIIELKGFKIEISGCFDSSRNQMSKIIKCNFGRIPLTKLNGYIDYTKTTFFTKFGTCGLKIWLFYKFK